MVQFQYDALKARNSLIIDHLNVMSFEMNVYLVKVSVGGQQGMLYEGDRPKRFSNTQHIREAFEGFTVLQADMTHDTPYDEMIGNPPKSAQKMVLPFSMTQPY